MDQTKDIIRLWPSRAALATDCGVRVGVVKQWERRNSIPSAYWAATVAGALTRGIPNVTLECLAQVAAQRRLFASDGQATPNDFFPTAPDEGEAA